MTTTSIPSTNLDLNNLYNLLEEPGTILSGSDDPLVNEELTKLLNDLYTVQADLSSNPLARPTAILTGTLSNAALVSLLMTEVRQTNALVAYATGIEVKNQQKIILGKNNEQIEKLKESAEATKKANDISNALGIFKWVMLAVSVVLTILSVVVTICTLGAAAPAIAIAVGLMVASVALLIVTSVPMDDELNTPMDMATTALSESIAEEAEQAIIKEWETKNGRKFSDLSDLAQAEIIAEAKETGSYSAMAIMITIQVLIAIAMLAAGKFANTFSAGANIANTATNTATTASRSAVAAALQAAKDAISANLNTIVTMTRQTSNAITAVKALGTIGSAAASGVRGELVYDAKMDEAAADRIKALVKYLQNNNDVLITLIMQLNQTSATGYEDLARILKANHNQKMRQSQILGTA